MDKQNMIHLYNGALLSNIREESATTCYNM